MYIEETQLDNFIRDSGLLTRAEFEEIEKKAKERHMTFSAALVAEGKLTEDDLRKVEAHILGIPFVDLKAQRIDFDTLSLIPEPIARNHNIIAFKRGDEALEVAMLDTDDLAAIEFVKKKVRLKILPRLTDAASIKSALLQYQKSLKAEFGDLIQGDIGDIKGIDEAKSEELSTSALKKLAEDVPVVRIVDTLLKHAILQGASDIHVEPLEKELLVRYRIDGILHDAMILPKNVGSSITARIKVLSNLKLDEKRLPQDGRFKVEISGEKVSLRVSTLPTHFGEKTVMRLLRETASGFSLEVLGFHGDALELVHNAMKQKTGMLLTTGPTGSGKTTTLYTVVDILNTPEVNISTIEDPIEYQMPRVNQTQVKPEIGLDFSMGLRTLMRQDPDIVMVGEIRDRETASLAINASLTGHLVLSTLHTNSAAGALPRLVDMKIEPFLIVSTVNLIIGQRLVRKLVGKEKFFLSKSGIETLGKTVDLGHILFALKNEKVVPKDATWDKIPFYKAAPAEESKDGYKGRVGIYEVLKVTPPIKEMIIHGATAIQVEDQAKKDGMLTMIEDGIFKAVQGLTTIEEVLRVVSE
ncbi:MAG: type II/IV secretion system protein [Candidatus Taylorbacteria bacterium]|nr:type II/IV secretion system protein [Candidatus Taylorbacteria bacterium]